MTPLEKRAAATRKTVARFAPREFKWGACDCARMAAWHVRQLGHTVPQVGKYRGALGARRRLTEMGFDDLPALVGSVLPEIAPAAALAGDVVAFASDDPIGAIGIVVGNGNMLAFHESWPVPVIMEMGQIDRAWSVLPSKGI